MIKKDEIGKLIAYYDRDSKRFHRFLIDANEWGIVGNIYVPKGTTSPTTKLEVVLENVPLPEEEEEEEKNK